MRLTKFTQILDLDEEGPMQALNITDISEDVAIISVGRGPAVAVRKHDILVAISGDNLALVEDFDESVSI